RRGNGEAIVHAGCPPGASAGAVAAVVTAVAVIAELAVVVEAAVVAVVVVAVVGLVVVAEASISTACGSRCQATASDVLASRDITSQPGLRRTPRDGAAAAARRAARPQATPAAPPTLAL